ncbi:MAG: hypothetical protein J3Q66DRAFT_88131 [Benniella sp.]|nr:MAG: hypothetical protein J3Q66DRAFT_88131 [Benniella sp.]
MFARRILFCAILGSLVSVVLLRPIKAVPDDSKVSIYNEDMVLVFQGTHGEFVANPLPEVASDWKSMCWKTLKTFWTIVTKPAWKWNADSCLDLSRHSLMGYDSTQTSSRINECYCGIGLGPDVDKKEILDESPNSLLSAVKARIEHPASDGVLTIEWTIGMKLFAGIIFDCRDDYASVDSAMQRWMRARTALRNKSSILNNSGRYLVRYKNEL